jgi:hypothetical protein
LDEIGMDLRVTISSVAGQATSYGTGRTGSILPLFSDGVARSTARGCGEARWTFPVEPSLTRLKWMTSRAAFFSESARNRNDPKRQYLLA